MVKGSAPHLETIWFDRFDVVQMSVYINHGLEKSEHSSCNTCLCFVKMLMVNQQTALNLRPSSNRPEV